MRALPISAAENWRGFSAGGISWKSMAPMRTPGMMEASLMGVARERPISLTLAARAAVPRPHSRPPRKARA